MAYVSHPLAVRLHPNAGRRLRFPQVFALTDALCFLQQCQALALAPELVGFLGFGIRKHMIAYKTLSIGLILA